MRYINLIAAIGMTMVIIPTFSDGDTQLAIAFIALALFNLSAWLNKS